MSKSVAVLIGLMFFMFGVLFGAAYTLALQNGEMVRELNRIVKELKTK